MKLSAAQDSSANEDDRTPFPAPQRHRSESRSDDEEPSSRAVVKSNKSGSESSSFDSSSSDQGDDDDDEPDYRPDTASSRRQVESPYDSFEEVNGSDSSQKHTNKVPRTSRIEFRNVDAELYDLRRSGRSRRAPKIIDDDDEDEEEEVMIFSRSGCDLNFGLIAFAGN